MGQSRSRVQLTEPGQRPMSDLVDTPQRLRWPAQCSSCGTAIPAGALALWDRAAKKATCSDCHAGQPELGGDAPKQRAQRAPLAAGSAGSSAQRTYERRGGRERERKEQAVADDAAWRSRAKAAHPVLGRLAAAVTPKPIAGPESQATRAWAEGAAGERRVAEILAACPGVIALHDRRIPGTRSNIDHVAVSATGVFVIDAKRYEGAVEVRDRGGWLRYDPHLYVGGRDRTKLLDGLERQCGVVRSVLDGRGHGAVAVSGVLCFVGSEWRRFFRRPLELRGMHVVWPAALDGLLAAGPGSGAHDVAGVAADLAEGLPAY